MPLNFIFSLCTHIFLSAQSVLSITFSKEDCVSFVFAVDFHRLRISYDSSFMFSFNLKSLPLAICRVLQSLRPTYFSEPTQLTTFDTCVCTLLHYCDGSNLNWQWCSHGIIDTAASIRLCCTFGFTDKSVPSPHSPHSHDLHLLLPLPSHTENTAMSSVDLNAQTAKDISLSRRFSKLEVHAVRAYLHGRLQV